MKRSLIPLVFVVLSSICLLMGSMLLAQTGLLPFSTHAQATPRLPIPVKVFFSQAQASLMNPSAVFPVTRYSPTTGVESYTLSELIAGPDLTEIGQQYFSQLEDIFSGPAQFTPASGCFHSSAVDMRPFDLDQNVKGFRPTPGWVTLHFCRATTTPGIGADARILAEINATLKQFSSVKGVVVLTVNGTCFGDERGGPVPTCLA